ncbi:MAG: hypothetical protein ABR908_03150, partial [Terriglobales bacterium]
DSTEASNQVLAFDFVSYQGIALTVCGKTPILVSLLGGAALQRCGKCIVLTAALAAEGRQFSNCTTTEMPVVAQFDDAPSKPEPRRTQSATKLFVLRLSFVDLRALCGGRFGKMTHYRNALRIDTNRGLNDNPILFRAKEEIKVRSRLAIPNQRGKP